jgi:type IX secretion system PorP/SprF family membrane protein
MKKYIYTKIIFVLLISFAMQAQQDPQFSQYMYNMSVINPAYATDNLGVYNFGGIFRSQWVGAVGAPNTASLFAHAPVSEKIETGLNIVHDEIGDGVVNETSITGDLAYSINVSKTDKLSFGAKIGVNFFSTDFGGFQLNDSFDESFNNLSQSFLNVGAGAFYFSDNYYLGVSVPNFLPNKQLRENSGVSVIGVDEMHIFTTGGYVFEWDNFKLKPSFMTKIVSSSPLSLDINLNALFSEKFEIGASYRLDDAFVGMANYRVTPKLRVGYAYDRTISNLGNFSSGSHEVMLLFDLDTNIKRGYDKSPRFF